MARNKLKIVEDIKPRLNEHYVMTCSEWVDLTDMAFLNPCVAVSTAFYYGYALGQRALKAEKQKALPMRQHQTGQP